MSNVEMLMSSNKFLTDFVEDIDKDDSLGLGYQEVLNMQCITLS